MTILKTVELCVSSGCIFWYVSYSSKRVFFFLKREYTQRKQRCLLTHLRNVLSARGPESEATLTLSKGDTNEEEGGRVAGAARADSEKLEKKGQTVFITGFNVI